MKSTTSSPSAPYQTSWRQWSSRLFLAALLHFLAGGYLNRYCSSLLDTATYRVIVGYCGLQGGSFLLFAFRAHRLSLLTPSNRPRIT